MVFVDTATVIAAMQNVQSERYRSDLHLVYNPVSSAVFAAKADDAITLAVEAALPDDAACLSVRNGTLKEQLQRVFSYSSGHWKRSVFIHTMRVILSVSLPFFTQWSWELSNE